MKNDVCVCVGKVKPGQDVVVFLSHGGSSRECVDAAVHLVSRGVAILVITSNLSKHMYNSGTRTHHYIGHLHIYSGQ